MRPSHRLAATAALLVVASSPAASQWSTDSMSTSRRTHASAVVGTKALFAGGKNAAGHILDSVDIYDDATGMWSQATLSEGHNYPTGASVGQYAFIAGGYSPTAPTTDVVEVYDSVADSWSVAHLSVPRRGLSAVAVGAKLIFAGGMEGDQGPPSFAVDIYDSAVGPPSQPSAWSTASLSVARGWMGATSVGPFAIFAGGSPDDGFTTLDTVDVYDDTTGTWTTTALSHDRQQIGATSLNGKAFFAGGDDCCTFRTEVDIYDSALGLPTDASAWSTASLTEARSQVAAAAVGDLVLFAGGWKSGPNSSVVDVYDDSTGLWSTTELSSGRAGTTPAVVGERALFGGGHFPATAVVDVYDIDFGERYCSPAVANSTGLPGVTLAFGRTAVLANDVSLVAAELPPNQFGYFLNSQTQASTFPVPNSQGTLCVGGAIGRYNGSVFNTGAAGTGSIQLDLASTPTPSGPVAIQAGETWNFTAWHRDLNPNATSNFTDGVGLTFQ